MKIVQQDVRFMWADAGKYHENNLSAVISQCSTKPIVKNNSRINQSIIDELVQYEEVMLLCYWRKMKYLKVMGAFLRKNISVKESAKLKTVSSNWYRKWYNKWRQNQTSFRNLHFNSAKIKRSFSAVSKGVRLPMDRLSDLSPLGPTSTKHRK